MEHEIKLGILTVTATLLASTALADIETRSVKFETEGAQLAGTLFFQMVTMEARYQP